MKPHEPPDSTLPDSLPHKESKDSAESQFATIAQTSASNATPPTLDSVTVPRQMGHYKIEALLGYGGMGHVFKAFDPALNRYAALKVLRAETPELARRFLQEARVQAKIDHENVCKVYEVGETDGKQFIAMQLIQGKTLGATAKELKLEQKIRIIKQVADALHAAHKEGLIHRDIKPTNIMVVNTEEGDWRPYVLDFGLAREQETPGLTMSGLVIGTAHYMAPEQARGETERLDRRTDVYSLGATLYETLSGRTPFQGNSTAEVLAKVLQEEPPPLRKNDASIPVDLETIVMKCLEKEPQKRYESAKAVAEDLQRYLDGEPIAARPIRWSERLVKKAKKNKVATVIVSAALLITFVLLGTLIWVQTKSSMQSRYAREFGEEVRSIESMIRSTYSAPLHDIRQELGEARKRLVQIETRTRDGGRWAYGPGHNALGLGYFALDDYDKALQNLQIAWQSNYREPSTAYALGKVMGIQYQRALRDAELIRNKVLREEQKAKLEKELRDPAVAYLKMARGGVESSAYVEGLLAFYENRYKDALNKAVDAYKQVGWSYEAKKLEGDLYLQSGHELENKGEYEKARKDYENAGAAYQTAIELRRSRAEIYLSEAERWIAILSLDSEKGISNEEALRQALLAADQAIAINPDAHEGYLRKMKAYTTLGTYLMYNTGEDPQKLMKQAIAMGQEAIKRNPKESVSFELTGTAYRVIGEYEIRHGVDPREALARAIENNQKSLQIKPNNPSVLVINGIAYSLAGEFEMKHGMDPLPTFRKAVEQYRASEQINPTYNAAFTNAGIAYWYIANYQMGRGIDPGSSFRDAIQQYQTVIKINPNNAFALFNLSLVYMDAGRHEMQIGRDPSVYWNQCLDGLKKTSKLMTNAYVPSALGGLYAAMGEYQLEQGKDPTSLLDQSRASCQKSISVDPSYYEPYTALGSAETLAARWGLKVGESPVRFFTAAHKAYKKSVELNDQEAELYRMMAEMYRWEAEWTQKQKRPAQEAIVNGLQMVQKTLSFDAENADALAIQGTLYLLKAREEEDRSQRANAASMAQSSLDRALKINRWLQREYGPLLKEVNTLTATQ